MKHYYALSWYYGKGSYNEKGWRLASYVCFGSRAARDAWVANGPAYQTDGGFREVVAASDPAIRRLRALEAQTGYPAFALCEEV